MAKKEKFGKFVLLEEVENVGIGREYRAAKLGTAGLEKIVSVLRLTPPLATNAEAVKSLMDQVKFAAQLQNPNVLKIYGIGKVDASYYISYEFLEGKSLRAIFSRCRQDGFPFSIDHALLIASKICSALEYAHQRKNESGGRYYHGLVTPGSVLVSYEGEVRLRGFGYWPSRLREAGALPEEASLYLAPEQVDGGQGDTKSDIFAVGAILFETLTGEPLFQGGRGVDAAARVARAKVQSPTTDDDGLPKPIAEILQRSLAKDPAARYGEIQEVRKAVDTLLFSGDFTPTTFNLAFFMHSLFREDIERESKSLREEKDASYIEFLTDTGSIPRAAATPVPGVPLETVAMPAPPPPPAAPAPRTPAHTPVPPVSARSETPHTPAPLPLVPPPPREHPAHKEPAHREPGHPPAHPSATSTDSGFTFHKTEAKGGSRMPLVAGAVAAVLLLGVGGWFAWTKMRTPPAPPAPTTTTLTAEAAAAVARVKELEDKLAAIEAEKAAAEAKAAEDAKKKLEAQAAAKGQAVDPAALAKAQEEATKKARAEQEKKAQEERKRLEDEKKAEEARLADERRKQEEEAARVAAAATTTTLAAPTTTTAPAAPAVRAGSLVNLSDPGVIAPVAERVSPPLYPQIALRQRLEGTVELNVLVDERGAVADVQVVTGAGGKSGLNEAAVDNVRKRRYRPATKDGVPVKVWVPVRVQFKLPKT